MTFKDHFSPHAADYAAYRPTYPETLFQFVAGLPAERKVVWDCATGNGQAALGLAPHFGRVIATDASEAQIAQAVPHPGIAYRVAPAEASGLAGGSVDLVAVAQAAHWFDFERFYAEVRRVLSPGGAVALWAYDLPRLAPELDPLIDRFGRQTVGPYWPPERKWVDDGYRDLPFPFQEIPVPRFELAAEWPLERFLSYLSTWSAVKRHDAATGRNAVAELRPGLAAVWGDPEAPRPLRWPVAMRAGRL